MKNKGFIQVFTILLALACIYQLSFTWKTKSVEKKAEEWAKKTGKTAAYYLDSMGPQTVYNMLGIIKYTYMECKEKEIGLGLDLKGGMNVTMEVSVADIVKGLSNNSKNQKFLDALENANKKFTGQTNFIDLFKAEWEKLAPNEKLAPIFTNKDLKDELPYDASNQKVYDWLSKQAKQSVSRAYQIINQRIDQFGVVQPNVQELGNGRILVELPGVDDPKRVRNILQSSAKLEFWNTYHNYESWKFLESANEIVKNKLAAEEMLNNGDKKDTSKAITLTGVSKDSSKTDTSKKQGTLTQTGSKTDTSKNKSPEQLKKENPILSLIIPNTMEDPQSKQQRWADGAGIGYVPTKEMAKLDEYFNLPEVKAVLPPNFMLRWSFKSTDKNRAFYMLYGIKAGRDGLPALPGDVVTSARKTVNPGGEIAVSMTMSPEGANDWRRITAQAAPTVDAVAIMLDDKIYSAPTVRSEIANGMSEISGGFDDREADDLANILKAGKLPAPTRIVEESIVGPTLGESARKAGIFSLFLGFVAVVVFVFAYYGRGAWYGVIALLINLFFLIAIMAGFNAALTLPGLAGLVLTMGMALDCNVLINERIKEELSLGKSYANAVTIGYKHAFSAILDSHVTQLIAAIIMAYYGSGPVKGFAVVLIIGIFTSLYTGVLLSRLINEWDMKRGHVCTFTTNLFKGFQNHKIYNFMSKRKLFYISSGLFILLGIGSMFYKGFSTGVDFKGGWTFTVQFKDNKVTGDEIKIALGKVIKENVEVKTYGTNNRFRITTAYKIDDQSHDISEKVEATVLEGLKEFNIKKSDILSTSKIGPTIAADVRKGSFMAVILAVIGIFLYIVIRFKKLEFGMGGAISLLHDVLIILAIFSLLWGIMPFPMDVDQAFIGALLTVLGYSINDTVVVFDRIREFLGFNKYDEQEEVINGAVNQTLSRTIVTALCTIITLLMLFLFGGEGLKGFTFALLIGIIVGTYSSIFIASAIAVDFGKKKK
ncbi:MAG: protein translocase subunit SecDF [Bacteroidetes bacterium]|nr:protein translocase subunit SecDF [Bacteroidota bacterium]